MPTLYDNFSQVRQYIDQGKPDLTSYVTKTELANCSYATTSQLSSYLPLSGGTLNGNLTLGNTYFLTVGTERAWKLFEDGSGGNAYICLQANVDSKHFYIRDNAGNNIRQIYESSNDTNRSFVKNFTPNTYTNNITPNSNGVYTLGNSSLQWAYTYTNNLILDGININDTLSAINSTNKTHYGTAVHDRTSYTVTATVDDFETDSNGNPLAGTTICIKLTSITGTNPATLYPVKFIVNGKELPRWYDTAAITANGRNWYRDMSEGAGRYWYWVFDGTYWVWHGISSEQNTTYSNMTDAEASAGTSTTGRLIKPVTLATYYTAKSCFSYDSSTGTLTITI